jgi:phospholipid/cholesterol/gamma-HCH transport system substrate-binding protein
MKQQSKLELVVGVFVLAGLAAVGYLALRIGAGAMLGGDTYALQARFTNSGGLNPGSNVLVAGVPVGRVESVKLNPDDYSSLVRFSVRKDVQLPLDTIASIKTTGLIGDKFLALAPGGETQFLAAGALITDTESTVDLESLISRFAFGDVSTQTAPATPSPAPALQP